MDGKKYDSPVEADAGDLSASVISIEQLRHLVRLLDRSDVSELELRCIAEGTRLVLRKVKAPQSGAQPTQLMPAVSSAVPPAMPEVTEHKIVAPLVGTFHVWARPKGGALVAAGDRVKAGQLVGTIESLNVLTEVETLVAGRVAEILVQDGQPVEYGQLLMTIDTGG